eukprot:272447-Prymnesium_polylepis.2
MATAGWSTAYTHEQTRAGTERAHRAECVHDTSVHPFGQRHDMLGIILSDFTAAAPAICVCKRWAEVARPVLKAMNPLKALAAQPTITQGRLEEELLLCMARGGSTNR